MKNMFNAKKGNAVRKDADNESTMALMELKKQTKKRNRMIIGIVLVLLLGVGAMIWRIPGLRGNSDAVQRAAKQMEENKYTEAIATLTKEIDVKKDDPDLYLNRSIVYLTRARKEGGASKSQDYARAKEDAEKALKMSGGSISARMQLVRIKTGNRSTTASNSEDEEKVAARNAYADFCSENDISREEYFATAYAYVGGIDTNQDDVPEYLMISKTPGTVKIASYRESKLWEVPLTKTEKLCNQDSVISLAVSKDNSKVTYINSSYNNNGSIYYMNTFNFDKNEGFVSDQTKTFQGEMEDVTADAEAYLKKILGEGYYTISPNDENTEVTKNFSFECSIKHPGEDDLGNQGEAYYKYSTYLKSYGINIYNPEEKTYDDWKEAYIDYFSNEEHCRAIGRNASVSIQDLNEDGIPEILIKYDDGEFEKNDGEIYTFANHRVQSFDPGTQWKSEKVECMSKEKDNTIVFRGARFLDNGFNYEFPRVEYRLEVTKSGFFVKEMVECQFSDEPDESKQFINWEIAPYDEVKDRVNELDRIKENIKWSKRIKNEGSNVSDYIKANL